MKRSLLLAFLMLWTSQSAFADGAVESVFNRSYGMAQGLSFDQKLNEQLPLEAEFTDEQGRDVRLADYFGKHPVILAMAYYECPSICTVVFRETFQTLQKLKFSESEKYEVVFVSISPKETPQLAAKKKFNYSRTYSNLPIAERAHFLTGSQASIDKVTQAVGFGYRYDPVTKQYVHPAGIMVATPEGKLSRYLYGIRYAATDLRLALVEASQNKIGTLADHLLLFCYQYDPSQGKYGFAVMGALRALGGVTATALGGFIFAMLRRERRRKKEDTKEGNA
jgi:protein SCO1